MLEEKHFPLHPSLPGDARRLYRHGAFRISGVLVEREEDIPAGGVPVLPDPRLLLLDRGAHPAGHPAPVGAVLRQVEP